MSDRPQGSDVTETKAQQAAAGYMAAITPAFDYEKKSPPLAPDYAEPATWAATADVPHTTALTPEGFAPIDPAKAKADCFYIHPTTFFSNKSWNAAIDHPRSTENMEQLPLASQASAFNSCARIYAPRYRQGTLGVFYAPEPNGRKALELAYDDVRRAFLHYLEHFNKGRPLILASHSQGTVHLLRLLEEEVVGKPLQSQLVAVYAIGFKAPREQLGKSLAQLPLSERPDQTGCLIAWDTYDEAGDCDAVPQTREHFEDGKWVRRNLSDMVATNPLTWTSNPQRVEAAHARGSVHLHLDGRQKGQDIFAPGEEALGIRAVGLSAPKLEQIATWIDDAGRLIVSSPLHRAFRASIAPDKNHHLNDYSLFYMDIRENAALRVETFLKNQD